MMRVGSIAETSATVSPNAASFSQKLPSHPYPLVLHPGKRNFAPRDFGRDSGLIGPGDRRIAMGDTTSSRQPAELSGFFEPAFVLPVRGDWLVELRGFEPETLFGAIAKSKKFDGDRVSRRTHARSATVFLTSKQPS
jgi:hypothetical protein